MSIKIKNIIIFFIFYFFITSSFGNEDLKSIGKFKDWEVFTLQESTNKVCFLQSSPVLQAPKKVERESRFFVTFNEFLYRLNIASGLFRCVLITIIIFFN